MKSLIAIAITAAMAIGAAGVGLASNASTAFACALPGCNQTIEHSHENCPLADCPNASTHEHSGVLYKAATSATKAEVVTQIKNQNNTAEVVDNNVASQELPATPNCGVSECKQVGTHSHQSQPAPYNCGVSGCTQTGQHAHEAAPTTPPPAYNCGYAGCTLASSHTHGSCGIINCSIPGNHNHDGNHGTNAQHNWQSEEGHH